MKKKQRAVMALRAQQGARRGMHECVECATLHTHESSMFFMNTFCELVTRATPVSSLAKPTCMRKTMTEDKIMKPGVSGRSLMK